MEVAVSIIDEEVFWESGISTRVLVEFSSRVGTLLVVDLVPHPSQIAGVPWLRVFASRFSV